jgi:drug/metabolite transporter (DMT)-like permease
MKLRSIRSDGILLLTAIIWGFAFTAQRAGMEHIGPFFYSGVRFLLGLLVLLPFWRRNMRNTVQRKFSSYIFPGLLAGVFLTLGVLFQQVGIVYTTAGKAGFITGLYVVLVPVFAIWIGRRTHLGGWIGALMAVIGLYLLSISGSFSMSRGDVYVLVSAVFWAIHVLVLAKFARDVPFIPLAVMQYAVCALVSFVIAGVTEPVSVSQLKDAIVPIIYGGAVSVGIAYTLQIVGQKEAHPTHAAIILSLEGVFAAVGGFLVLGERLSGREAIGCALMFVGMMVSQLNVTLKRATPGS